MILSLLNPFVSVSYKNGRHLDAVHSTDGKAQFLFYDVLPTLFLVFRAYKRIAKAVAIFQFVVHDVG